MNYENLTQIENLFQAWEEFKKGKGNKKDVQVFERHLEDNLFALYRALKNKSYKHGGYFEFYVNDPKRRHIHKAYVADRIVHHLLYKYLYEVFDKIFIFDSYSCRLDKGTHRVVKRLEQFTGIVSKNYTYDCWALKLDIKKFFESINHDILKTLISQKVQDENILWLIDQTVDSFQVGVEPLNGIPLGNLTSQIFANIYLNELDQFIKHKLKIRYYLRYADDFIILDQNRARLYRCIDTLIQFLDDRLKLKLHPNKITIRKLSWGIDFCGYVVLPHHILPRTKTKRRIFKKIIKSEVSNQALQSYLGYFSHANSYRARQELVNLYWFGLYMRR